MTLERQIRDLSSPNDRVEILAFVPIVMPPLELISSYVRTLQSLRNRKSIAEFRFTFVASNPSEGVEHFQSQFLQNAIEWNTRHASLRDFTANNIVFLEYTGISMFNQPGLERWHPLFERLHLNQILDPKNKLLNWTPQIHLLFSSTLQGRIKTFLLVLARLRGQIGLKIPKFLKFLIFNWLAKCDAKKDEPRKDDDPKRDPNPPKVPSGGPCILF